MIRRIALLLLSLPILCARVLGQGDAKKETVMFKPEPIPVEAGAIQNAGCGTEIWHGGPSDGVKEIVQYAVRVSEHSANAMIRVGWDAYEPRQGEYLFEKMDPQFRQCLAYGQKLDIACFVTSNAGTKQTIDDAYCCYPAYVHEAMQASDQKDVVSALWLNGKRNWEPNFENTFFFERYDALLKAFAAYLEGTISVEGRTVVRKQLVRCIELRHFGYWGEGAYLKPLVPTNSACLIRFADSFVRHFPDIWLVVPTNGMRFSPAYDGLKDYHFHLLTVRNQKGLLGTFRDNWGDDEKRYQVIYYAANRYEQDGVRMYELLRDRWKFAPLVGEPGRWGPREDGFHPYWNLVDQVAYLHPAVIRNCNVSMGKSATSPTDYSILDDPKALAAFHRMYALIGFRYLVKEGSITRGDGWLEAQLAWQNIGLTPTYDRWTVTYFLENEAGAEIWRGNSTLDLRRVLPDEQAAPGSLAGTPTKHTDRFENVPAGGRLWLQIVDPDGISPPMALSIKGRSEKGAYLLTP